MRADGLYEPQSSQIRQKLHQYLYKVYASETDENQVQPKYRYLIEASILAVHRNHRAGYLLDRPKGKNCEFFQSEPEVEHQNFHMRSPSTYGYTTR